MNLNIVQMEKEHLNIINNNLKDFDDFWNQKVLQDEFSNQNSKYFVLLQENEIVGFAGLWFNIDEAHIMNIAIKKQFRRNRLGTKMLEFLIDFAKLKNKKCITLEVNEKNTSAINLYKKLKFEIVGKRKRYYENKLDAIIMTKIF